jgi:hypothetical protein
MSSMPMAAAIGARSSAAPPTRGPGGKAEPASPSNRCRTGSPLRGFSARPMDIAKKIKLGLDETRTLVLGAQVLIGFQFRGAFADGFDRLPAASRAPPCARAAADDGHARATGPAQPASTRRRAQPRLREALSIHRPGRNAGARTVGGEPRPRHRHCDGTVLGRRRRYRGGRRHRHPRGRLLVRAGVTAEAIER